MKLRFKDEKVEFWCSVCDHNLVDIDNPQSGNFYEVCGHKLKWDRGWVEIHDVESVMYAVCHDCSDKVRQEVKRK